MKKISLALLHLLLGMGISAQNLEVEGKMLVKDINTIATFQSSVKNSFIRLETNTDPMKGTNVWIF